LKAGRGLKACHRREQGKGRRVNTGDLLQTVLHAVIQLHPRLVGQVQQVKGRGLDRHVVQVESGLFRLQPDQALGKQGRDGYESKRERHLNGDKGSAQNMARNCTRGARFQEIARIGGAGSPGG
jgi:hypothetical protein